MKTFINLCRDLEYAGALTHYRVNQSLYVKQLIKDLK